ncbi:MAG: SPOR domain-containing protein [Microthrixaceae bacterium]
MRRDRFALWVALAAIGVGVASFGVALQALDDGGPDPAPTADRRSSDTTVAPIITTTSTTTSTTTTPGAIPTPAWITIVASEASRPAADEAAAEVAARGHPAGVVRSDDYESLKAGLWVAFAGPFGSADEARAMVDTLKADGIDGAYVRCIGSTKACRDHQEDGDD